MPRESWLLKFFGLTYAISWVWTLVALIPPGTPLRTAFVLSGTITPALVPLWPAPLDAMTRSGTRSETQ